MRKIAPCATTQYRQLLAAGGGHDHLALALGQAAFTPHRLGHHQGVVVGKKGPPLGWATGKSQKYIGHKPGFFLHLQHLGFDVVGQVIDFGGGVAGVHGVSSRGRCF